MEPILEYLRDSENIELPDYYFYDANDKVNFDLTDRTTLTMAGYWGSDHLDFSGGPDDSPIGVELTWGNRTLTSRLRQVLSRSMFFTVAGSVSRYRSKWSFENDGTILEESYDRLLDYSMKSGLEILGIKNHHFKTGIWFSLYDFKLEIDSQDESFVEVDDQVYNLSGYVRDRWRIHPKWEIQPGIRAYYHEAGERTRLDPRLSIVHHYRPDMRFKIAGGRYTQWIHLINFGEGMANFDIWSPTDGSMKPSYSDQIVLGYEWEPREDLEFTTETYYTDMHDVSTFNMLTDEQSTDGSDAFIFGDGFAYGIEFMLRRKMGRLQGWVGYTLSWTQRRFPDTYQNDGEWYYPKWDRRHDFSAGHFDPRKLRGMAG